MIRLALLRHGPTAWNRAGRIQGRSDIPLDPDTKQDLATMSLPSPWDQAELWASPLQRAVQTAHTLTGCMPLTDVGLTEMDWGEWEGKHGKDLASDPHSGFRHIENWGWNYRPPKGESPQDVRTRLEPWLSSLTRDTVAVCHIGVMRVLLAQAHGWDFKGPAPFRVKRSRLFVIEIIEGQMRPWPEPVRLTEQKGTSCG